MSHTKEPWALRASHVPGSDYVHIHATERERIAVTTSAADARRIVACVNACAGIPVDMLEAMPSGPAALLPMYSRLERQLDELLAALEAVLADMQSGRFDEDAARAAVAKVKAKP